MDFLNYISTLSLFIILLIVSEVVTQTKHPLEDLLVAVDTNSVSVYDLNGKQRNVISQTGGVFVDYDCSTGEILWTNIENKEIYAAQTPGNSRKKIVRARSNWLPISIATDYITRKVYIADRHSGTVSLYDLNSEKFAVIINSNLTEVLSIGIDLQEGYLFVQDKYHIISSELDGTNRKVIYSAQGDGASSSSSRSLRVTLPLDISRISINLQTKRLYWADKDRQEVVSVNYQGKDKKVHFHGSSKFSTGQLPIQINSVTVINNVLYWSNGRKIYKIDLNAKDKKQFTELDVKTHFVTGIKCLNRAQIPNPCKKNNGGCQDLCVFSKSSKSNYKCLCRVGFELYFDKKSCVPVQEYAVFSMEERLRGMSLSFLTPVDVIDPGNFDVKSNTKLDINVNDGVIYWTSSAPDNMLHQLKLSDGTQKILEPNLMSTAVSRVAYDWASHNLYYITSTQPVYNLNVRTISVLNVNNPTFSYIIVNDAKGIVDLTIHPNRGYLYFSQDTRQDCKISRVNLDGSNTTTIYQKSNKKLTSLALDYESDRLYWIEVSFSDKYSWNLRHSNLNGGDIKNVDLPVGYKDLSSIAIHFDTIYAVANQKTIIHFNKLGGTRPSVMSDYKMCYTASDIKIFSRARQVPRSNHPCVQGNRCEKFCFGVPKEDGGLNRVCGCPTGFKLASNERSCIEIRPVGQAGSGVRLYSGFTSRSGKVISDTAPAA